MIEEKLRELGGIKTLISHNYYSRDEFWSIWNKRNYDAGQGDHRSAQHVSRPVHEDLPRGDGSARLIVSLVARIETTPNLRITARTRAYVACDAARQSIPRQAGSSRSSSSIHRATAAQRSSTTLRSCIVRLLGCRPLPSRC